jgi:hypothetical protein
MKSKNGEKLSFWRNIGYHCEVKAETLSPTHPQPKRRGDYRPHRVDQARTDQVGKPLELLSGSGRKHPGRQGADRGDLVAPFVFPGGPL